MWVLMACCLCCDMRARRLEVPRSGTMISLKVVRAHNRSYGAPSQVQPRPGDRLLATAPCIGGEPSVLRGRLWPEVVEQAVVSMWRPLGAGGRAR